MAINILLEATPTRNGIPIPVRMSSAPVLSDGTQVDGLEWLPVITQVPTPSFTITEGGGAIAPMSISMGSVSFRIGKRYANREWNTLHWPGAPVSLWIGEAGKPFSTYRQWFTGSLSGLARTGNVAELALRTVEGQLDVPLLSKRMAGTGGPEGPAGKKGTLRPFALGFAKTVAPVEVDPALLVYQVHGYGPVEAIPTLYEYAQPLAPAKANVATWTELAAATLKPGEWITCNALGMFRLGGTPKHKLTADVRGAAINGITPTTVAQAVPLLLHEAGVSAPRIGNMDALDFNWAFYTSEPISVADLVKQAALDAGAYLFPDKAGVWQCGRHRAIKSAQTLRVDRTSEPLVQTINELNVADPAWKVEVQYDRCWSVHNEGDISPKLIELEGKIVAADEVLEDLKDQAERAVADAAAARKEMEAMLADGVLDRSDKRRAIDRLEAERITHRQLEGVQASYDVAAQWKSYDDAWKAVEAYMVGLVPSIYDNSAVTPVVRETYLAHWATYETAKQVLLNAITGKVKDTANKANDTADKAKDTADQAKDTADKAKESADATKANFTSQRLEQLLRTPIDKINALTLDYGAQSLVLAKDMFDTNQTGIRELRNVILDDKGGIRVELIRDLGVKINEGVGKETLLREAAIRNVEAAYREADKIVAESVSLLGARVTKDVGEAKTTAEGLITGLRRVIIDDNGKLLATHLDEVNGRITTEVAGAKTSTEGLIRDLRNLVLDEQGNVRVERIQELGTKITEAVNKGLGVESQAREAAIRDITRAYKEDDALIAERVNTLSSSITGPDGHISKINAVIEGIQKVETDNNSARATEYKTLQSRLDNFNGATLEQSFKTVADRVDGVSAQWGLKVQTDQNGQKYIAGMAIGIDNGVSATVFSTDSFKIMTPGAAPRTVFTADANGLYAPELTVARLTYGALVDQFAGDRQNLNPAGGFQDFPGGFVLQWGRYRGMITRENAFTVTFSKAFPTMCFVVMAMPYIDSANAFRDLWLQNVGTPSTTGATFFAQAATSDNRNIDGFDWIAFGR